MSAGAPLVLRDGDRAQLEALARSGSASGNLARRARILLLAADGVSNAEIAQRTGTSRSTVEDWGARYADGGIAALEDLPRSGRPAKVDEIEVVVATLAAGGHPPPHLGARHWTAGLLGAELGISRTTVTRLWRKWGLQPSRAESFKFSTDPELDARIGAVVGVYLNPPTNALVVCIDEMSSTAPIAPSRPGIAQEQTHDHLRFGATALLAALDLATADGGHGGYPRHRDTGFLAFVKEVAKANPNDDLHLVVDDPARHRHPAVGAWVAGDPRIAMHFTPGSGSWLNLVKIFFAISTAHNGRVTRAGAVGSVADPAAAIGKFIDGWSEGARPFVWTKDADPIITQRRAQQPSERATGTGGVGRTTDELAVAFEAAFEGLRARLDALESAIGEVAASRVTATDPAAAIEAPRAHLYTAGSASGGVPRSPTGDAAPAEPADDAVDGYEAPGEMGIKDWWLAKRLSLNTGPVYTRVDLYGSLAFGGVVRTPGSGVLRWQSEFALPDVIAADLPSVAVKVAALGHPLRLELLRRILLGASTVGEFQDIEGIATTGQAHHHLRELRAAGLVVSGKRNHYTIPRDEVVPFLVIVGAALGRRVHGSAGPAPLVGDDPAEDAVAGESRDAVPSTKFWMLDHLAFDTGPEFTRGDVSGSIAFGGVVRIPLAPDGFWAQSRYTAPDVIAADLPAAAVVLAALGHPLRLELLRRMLLGANTVGQLQDIEGIGSTGQVHHHLRELRAAGLVASHKRNHYAIPRDRAWRLLMIVAAAGGRRVTGGAGIRLY